MFERFTERAVIVIRLAQEESRRLGHNFVGTEQILLGLLAEGKGVASKVLRSHKLNLKDSRAAVQEIRGRGEGFVAVEIPFTPRAKKLLEAAWNAARELGHNSIGTEHLLLGLLAVDDGVAKQVLNDFNIDLEKMKSDVFDFLQTPNKQQQMASANPTHAQSTAPPDPRTPLEIKPTENAQPPAIQKPSNQLIYSTAANKSLELAQKEALRVSSNVLELEHLLLGIFGNGSTTAHKMLAGYSINLQKLRSATAAKSDQSPSRPQTTEFEFSSQVIMVLRMAAVSARAFGSLTVTTEHILLALLSYEESKAVKGLQALGVNIELFMDELRKEIKAAAVEEERRVEAAIKAARVAEGQKKKADTGDFPQPTLALTEMVEHAISLAREEAHRLGHAEVDTDHVLLGLMAEADGLASLALHVWDVKTKELRQESDNMPGREKCDSSCESRCGSKVNELILAARQLAREAKRTYVGTDHVLLALLADEEGAGLKVLRNLSIDVDRLKKMLQNANMPPQVDVKYSAIVPLSKQKGFERFSDEAIKALMYAKEEASRLGHSQIDSQFLLLGICDERLNKGAERLRKIGISIDDLRFEVEQLTGHGGGDCGGGFSFCEHALQALTWSFDKVVGSGIEVVRPEHLFVGIILEESGPALTLLQQFNVSIEKIRAKTILKIKQSVTEAKLADEIAKVSQIFGLGYAAICENMSAGSASVVLRGYSEAKILSHTVFEPSHILLGLFDERSCMALKAAEMNGLDVNRLRLFIDRINERTVSESRKITVWTQTDLALMAARDFAELCGSSLIEPDHLLFGALKNDSCLELLHALNLDYKNYKETVFELLKDSHPSLRILESATIPVGTRTSSLKLIAADFAELFTQVEACAYKPPSGSFSKTAKAASRLAAFEARRLGRSKVGTDHILFGICSCEDSVAAAVLKEIGVTSDLLRNRIEESLDRGKRSAVKELSFSKNTIQVFEKAFEIAQSIGSTTLTPDQLFIGILTLQNISDAGRPVFDGCSALAVLRSLGVDLAWLHQSFLNRLTPLQVENIETAGAQARQQSQSKRVSDSTIAIKRFENFAADALKAVLIAHEEARESRRSLVGTEQILLALVLDREGKVGRILEALGLTAETVRAGIEHLVLPGPGLSAMDELYTAEANSVFLLAKRNGDFFKSKIGSDLLLLSLITDQKSQASIILDWAGVDLAMFQEIMTDELTTLSVLEEDSDATLKSGGCLSEPIRVIEYQAALKKTVDQIQEQNQEQAQQSEED